MGTLYIGLISGTSADGIDAALVAFDDDGHASLRAAAAQPYDTALRAAIERAVTAQTAPFAELVALDARVGDAFARAALAVCEAAGVEPAAVSAIGSHGQTLAHHPSHGGTLAVGDPNRIAARTGIPVCADFRRADIAVGGEGAPLAPLFHAAVFGSRDEDRAVVNLGGIANLSVLRRDGSVVGFDTGPANTLLDLWARRHARGAYDDDGAFARTGRVDPVLLASLRADDHFGRSPPKSTGRESFDAAWLDRRVAGSGVGDADVQATLAELTASTIADALRAHAGGAARVYLCGGGVRNGHLVERLRELSPSPVETTAALGVEPERVEAMLFAWLARERVHARSPAGLHGVTGASAPAVLGGVWLPPRDSTEFRVPSSEPER